MSNERLFLNENCENEDSSLKMIYVFVFKNKTKFLPLSPVFLSCFLEAESHFLAQTSLDLTVTFQ